MALNCAEWQGKGIAKLGEALKSYGVA